MMSKIFSTLMTMVVVTTITVGKMDGRLTRQNTCHSLAPSTRAASINSCGIPLYAADKMTMQKPVQIHTPTAMRAKLLIHGRSTSQPTGSPPKATTMALRRPICGSPAGMYAYMNFHITPAPANEMAIGMNMMERATFS